MPRRGRHSRHGGGSSDRKTLQLCAQIRRALEMSLMGDFEDEVFGDLMVDSVAPHPDESRVLVVLVAHGKAAELGKATVTARLEAVRGHLIEEVAHAVNRSKLPELAFELVKAPEAAAPDPDATDGEDPEP